MKWRAVGTLLIVALVVTSLVAPAALAEEPRPEAPVSRSGKPSPEGRFLQTLQKARKMRGTVRGQISALGGNEIEVTVGRGESAQPVILRVNGETTYHVPEIEDASLADLEVDMLVVIRPTVDDRELAETVGVVSPRQLRSIDAGQRLLRGVQRLLGNNARHGEVIAVGSDRVTISTPQGEVELVLGENTRFLGADGQVITLNDLSVGDAINVVGRPDPTAPINAGVIKIMPDKAD